MYYETSKYVKSHDEKTSVEFVARSVYWRTMVLSFRSVSLDSSLHDRREKGAEKR